MEEKDIVTIGGGVCGIMSNYELADNKSLTKLMLDNSAKGMSGLRNDGKINIHAKTGTYENKSLSDDEIISLIKKQIERLSKLINLNIEPLDKFKSSELERIAREHSAEFWPGEVLHIGSDRGKVLMKDLYHHLRTEGVEIKRHAQVYDIEILDNGKKKVHYLDLKTKDRYTVLTNKIIVCPGRNKGEKFTVHITQKLGLETIQNLAEVGVRVELKSQDYPLTGITYDPKLHMGMVRTFCTNPQGYVVGVEKDREEGITLVNGHALNGKKSENTNFALLLRMNSPNPYITNSEWTRLYSSEVCLESDGRVIAQPLDYFLKKDHTPQHIFGNDLTKVRPTLKNHVWGDLAQAMPIEVYTPIREALLTLSEIIHDYIGDNRFRESQAIIYGPETKNCITRVVTSGVYESPIPGLYFGGDGAGNSRGINGAMVVAHVIAKDILSK